MINIPPPKDEDIEEKVLGALLSSVEAPPICIPMLGSTSFTGARQNVFSAVREDYEAKGDVDIIRVEHILKNKYDSQYPDLARLTMDWIDQDKAEEYCGILNGLRSKRDWLHGIYREVQNINQRSPEELFTNTENIIRSNLDSITIPGLTPSQIEERDRTRSRGEQIYTGDPLMDKTFFKDSGSRRGQMIVPFADTGHGKTFWAVWLTARYLEQGYKGVYCIFESTDTKIKDRVKSNLQDASKIDNLTIADVGQGMLNLEDSVSLIKYHNAVKDIDFFVADHLRIISVPGLPDWKDTEKISTCVNRYNKLCQEVNAHGVCLSQVNRATMNSARGWEKDPDLNNLFGSSAIEQAAEVAISIFRPKRIEELREYWRGGEIRAVKGPSYNDDGKTYDANSVFIRQKKTREGEQYIPYVRFVHGSSGLERVTNSEN